MIDAYRVIMKGTHCIPTWFSDAAKPSWMVRLALLPMAWLILPAQAFDIDGSKWLGAEADFYVSIPGLSKTQISWNIAVIEALNQWSEQTAFTFNVIEESKIGRR